MKLLIFYIFVVLWSVFLGSLGIRPNHLEFWILTTIPDGAMLMVIFCE